MKKNMGNILEINNVSKTYGKTAALEAINVSFEEGKIYGLLGRNGAGKTTLLNLITNKFEATTGEILLGKESVWENPNAQSKICYMTEKNMFPKEFTVLQLLKSSFDFYENFDLEYALNLAEQFKLNIGKKFKTLSKGFESITKIIIALSTDCPLVLMDEPVLGLDAAVRDKFYRIFLDNFARKPRTFIISTHLIEEVSGIIEEAVIIDSGRLLLKKPVEEMLQMGYCVAGKSNNVDKYAEGRKVVHSEMVGNFKTITIYEPVSQRDNQTAASLDLEIVPVQLQKLFVHLTGD
ncbi:MAG: ABC transporter ATP-binding protein [Bacillota bacterium]|nr:ABC transporter ATP-binding protein [Bacillota bacterium]